MLLQSWVQSVLYMPFFCYRKWWFAVLQCMLRFMIWCREYLGCGLERTLPAHFVCAMTLSSSFWLFTCWSISIEKVVLISCLMCMSLCVPWFLFTSKHSPKKENACSCSKNRVSVLLVVCHKHATWVRAHMQTRLSIPSCYLGRKAITVQLPYSLIIKFFLPNPLYESTETPARCLQNLGKCPANTGLSHFKAKGVRRSGLICPLGIGFKITCGVGTFHEV